MDTEGVPTLDLRKYSSTAVGGTTGTAREGGHYGTEVAPYKVHCGMAGKKAS